MSNPPDLIDCISAKELLRALNTLQQISENNEQNEVQLSFSNESNSLFNTVHNNAKMDFQIYMAMKNKVIKTRHNRKNSNKCNKSNQWISKKRQQKITVTRKSLTPQKQNLQIKLNRIPKSGNSQLKLRQAPPKSPIRKSLSPVNERKEVQKPVSKNIFTAPKKPSIPLSLYNPQKIKENKENIQQAQQNNIQNFAPVKISQNSKKIMVQMQKKGKTYVPIHQRTNQLIKQKQEKIAKIQRANLAQKQFQQRQCTFKPCINSFTPKINNSNFTGKGNAAKSKQIANRHRLHKVDQQHIVYEQSFEQNVSYSHNNGGNSMEMGSGACRKSERVATECESSDMVNFQQSFLDGQAKRLGASRLNQKDRPKNQKYNILLDLIN